MIKRSKSSEAREVESLKARFAPGGVIQEDAIRAFAAEQSARLWTGRHFIYASQQAMADGFAAEIIRKVQA